jgi:signal transduction histidine kinase
MAAELQRSFAELEAERDALRHFVADASHELRTPITALRMHNELAQGPARNDPAARDEFLQESQRQIERLEWITRNLLDLSRLDAGLVGLDWAQHDAGDVARAAASPFRLVAQEKRIDLVLALPDEPLPARCDRQRLELAVSNLIDNALKFTPPGGRVEVGAAREAAGIRIWVADDGPGIDPADLPHLFERFYRGRSSAARGSGLGLAIVKSIIQAHGGQTRVESAPGRGSRFELDLPRPG